MGHLEAMEKNTCLKSPMDVSIAYKKLPSKKRTAKRIPTEDGEAKKRRGNRRGKTQPSVQGCVETKKLTQRYRLNFARKSHTGRKRCWLIVSMLRLVHHVG